MREPTTPADFDAEESRSEARYAARHPETVRHEAHQHVFVRQNATLLACDCGEVVGIEEAS